MKDKTAVIATEPIKAEIIPQLTYEDEDKTPIVITKTLQEDENNTYILPQNAIVIIIRNIFCRYVLYNLYFIL